MLAGLINSAKSAVSTLLLQYVARASVAIPFVVAAGFALAACTMMLVERFGHITAYWLVAGALAVVGVVAAAVVSVKEEIEEEAEQAAEASDTGEVVSDAAAQAMVQAPSCRLGCALQHSRRDRRSVGRCATVGAQLAVGNSRWPDRLAVLAKPA